MVQSADPLYNFFLLRTERKKQCELLRLCEDGLLQ